MIYYVCISILTTNMQLYSPAVHMISYFCGRITKYCENTAPLQTAHIVSLPPLDLSHFQFPYDTYF